MKNDIQKKIEKIVVNVGLGRLSALPQFEDKLKQVMEELSVITGQKSMIRPARQSIAGFKLRTGTPVGLKVTLRKKRMEDFLKRLVHVVLPRVRDFRGINLKSVDKNGNLSIGLKEQVVFPEVSPETSKTNFGMEITFVPKFQTSQEKLKAKEIYKGLGIPFKR